MPSYLDTTIVRELIFGHSDIRKDIKKTIEKDQTVISYYVQGEFISGLIKDLINFYFLFKNQNCNTIQDAIAIWENHYSSRKLKNILQLLGKVADKDSSANDKETRLFNLRMEIKRILEIFLIQFNNYVPNQTKCERINNNIQIKTFSEYYMKKIVEKVNIKLSNKCNGPKLIKAKVSLLNKLKDKKYQDKFDNELKKRMNKITENIDPYLKKHTCQKCNVFGDTFITIEARKKDTIYSTDKSFHFLGHIFNKNVDILKGSSKLRALISN